jgi:hypothetical protein
MIYLFDPFFEMVIFHSELLVILVITRGIYHLYPPLKIVRSPSTSIYRSVSLPYFWIHEMVVIPT